MKYHHTTYSHIGIGLTFTCLLLFLGIRYLSFWIYINGPKMLMMWGGMEECDICAEITGVSAKHWVKYKDACSNEIYKRYISNMIGIGLFLFLLFLSSIYNYFWYSYIVLPLHYDRMITNKDLMIGYNYEERLRNNNINIIKEKRIQELYNEDNKFL